MEEADAGQEGEAAAGAPSVASLDLTKIRGFQVLPDSDEASPDAAPLDEETRRHELAKELAARAARFTESVDDSIVLANDGAIRWLGDPVAKLVAGEETLKPRAVILADEALSAEGREAAQNRVALWLAAHIRKTLGPLLALVEVESPTESVRDLAQKLSQSLGILERERVKSQVKALDQNARGALRKLGVRFGAHYLYVPALLKPGARALCAQLWALPRGEADKEAVAEKLLHFASSGRTSFAVEPPASGEVYRVAGFRLCGDRAVRVDIVERLTDLIRAALPRHASGEGAAPGEGSLVGFVVTNQMTSLTGCSGEHFASILRSLGFASHQVNKAAYLAALKAAEPIAPAPITPIEPAAAAPEAQAEEGAVSEAAAEPLSPEASSPTPAVAEDEPAERQEEPTALESPPAKDDEAAPEAETAEPETSEPETSEPATAESDVVETEAAEPDAAEPEAAEVETAAESPATDAPAMADAPSIAETPATAEAASPGADELIEIWRPAPRRPRQTGRDHGRQHRQSQPDRQTHQDRQAHQDRPAQAAGAAEGRATQEGPARKPWRDHRPRPSGAPQGQAEGGRTADSHGQAAAHAPRPPREPGREDRRPQWRRDSGKGGRFEENRNAEAGADKGKPRQPPPEPRKPSINLDSPFAKLLDLKPLLKSRDTAK